MGGGGREIERVRPTIDQYFADFSLQLCVYVCVYIYIYINTSLTVSIASYLYTLYLFVCLSNKLSLPLCLSLYLNSCFPLLFKLMSYGSCYASLPPPPSTPPPHTHTHHTHTHLMHLMGPISFYRIQPCPPTCDWLPTLHFFFLFSSFNTF